jgi:uncharacterized membrane protein YozB (DUF420 family)
MLYWYYIGSTISLVLIGLGLLRRRNRRQHIPLMLSALTLDFLLVLAIEIRRHAVEKILAHHVSPLTVFHAGVSALVLIFYLIMAYYGYRILRNVPGAQQHHRQLAGVFITLRLLNFITSFFVSH